MPGSVGTGGELAFNRGLAQKTRICNEQIHRVYAHVQIAFQRVKIAIIVICNLRRDITTGYFINIIGSYIKRSDYRV